MCQKFKIVFKNSRILKQEHPIMLAQKFGEINHTMISQTSGLSAAFFIKCVLIDLLLKERIYKLFIIMCKEVYINLFQLFTHKS